MKELIRSQSKASIESLDKLLKKLPITYYYFSKLIKDDLLDKFLKDFDILSKTSFIVQSILKNNRYFLINQFYYQLIKTDNNDIKTYNALLENPKNEKEAEEAYNFIMSEIDIYLSTRKGKQKDKIKKLKQNLTDNKNTILDSFNTNIDISESSLTKAVENRKKMLVYSKNRSQQI